MPSDVTLATPPSTRWDGVARDLRHAIAATEAKVMSEWLFDAATYTGKAGVRRVVNMGVLIKRVGARVGAEGKELVQAYGEGRFSESLREQSSRAASDIGEVASSVGAKGKQLAAMAANPKRLPEAVVLVAAALVTSGGVDANGGVPDLDLTLGIDAHRSIFTHSIIAGTAVEGCLYAVCTLVGHVYKNLPAQHDPLFDLIEQNRARYLELASTGASAGIAFHLAADATVQPGAYHDLPFSTPMEGHQAILGANAVAEAADANKKRFEPRTRAKVPFVIVEKARARTDVERRSVKAGVTATASRPSAPVKELAVREQPTRQPRLAEGHTETAVPAKVLTGMHRSLWFGWLLGDDGAKRPIIVVPSASAHAHGHIDIFYGDVQRFASCLVEDVVPRLSAMSEHDQALRKSLVSKYKAALSETL